MSLVVGLALVAAACGDDEDSASPDGGSSETTSQPNESDARADLEEFLTPPERLPEVPPTTGEIPGDLSVYLIATGGETDELIAEGMRIGTDLLGWDLEVITTDRRDPVQGNAAVMSALQSGADALVIPSVDPAAIADGLAAAKEKGVPTIGIGSNEPGAFTALVNSLSPDGLNPDLYGQIMAAATAVDAERAGKTAHVGILTSGPLTFAAPMFEAFSEHLAEYCSGCTTELVDAPIRELATGQASNSIISALQRNSDLNYVLLLGPFSAGVRSSLDSNGFESVKIVGVVPAPAQLQEMVAAPDGFVGWVVVPNRYDGIASVDAVVRALTGGDPTVHNAEREPAWIVTPESEFDPSTLPELPVDYGEAFGEIWGLND